LVQGTLAPAPAASSAGFRRPAGRVLPGAMSAFPPPRRSSKTSSLPAATSARTVNHQTTRDAGQRHPRKVEKKMTMMQMSAGTAVSAEAGAKPPVGPLFGANEAENLSLLFDPPGAPACAADDRAQPGRLARLLPSLAATWF